MINSLGLTIGLVTAAVQASSHVVLKRSFTDFKPSVAYLFDSLLGLIIWVPFSLYMGASIFSLPVVLPYAFISAVLAEAYVFYILQKGTLSLTNTVFYTYPLFIIAFSHPLNHESLTALQWLAIGLILSGLILISLPQTLNNIKTSFKANLYLLYPLSSAFSVGISDSLSKNIINQTSAAAFLLALALAQVPVALVYYLVETQSLKPLKSLFVAPYRHRFTLTGSFLMVISMILYWYTFALLPASLAAPITASSPFIVLLLSNLFLKERLSFKDRAASLVIVIGILLVSSI
jgi:drug/metabolite transporter (DMT)-like permease